MADAADVTGINARWRADQITGLSSGAAVDSWPDTSGNLYAATGSGTTRPTWQDAALGGKPVVRFDGTDDTLVSGAPAGSQQQTIAAVVSVPAVGTRTIRGSSGTGGLQLRTNGNAAVMVKQFVTSIGTSSGSAVVASTPVVLIATYDATSGAWAFYKNGAAWNSGTASGTALTLTATTTRIGSNQSPAEFFSGDMAELIVWPRILTAGERATVNSYVQDRYGITVSDYVSSATGTGALVAASPTLGGAGTARLTGSGALISAAPTLAGTGGPTVVGAGALTAGTPTLGGAGGPTVAGTGALTADVATLSGDGLVELTGSGELVAEPATLAATGVLILVGMGALTALAAELDGAGIVSASGPIRDITVTIGAGRSSTLTAAGRSGTLTANPLE